MTTDERSVSRYPAAGKVRFRRSQTSVVYPPTGSWPKSERKAPHLHSSWGKAHFTLLSNVTSHG